MRWPDSPSFYLSDRQARSVSSRSVVRVYAADAQTASAVRIDSASAVLSCRCLHCLQLRIGSLGPPEWEMPRKGCVTVPNSHNLSIVFQDAKAEGPSFVDKLKKSIKRFVTNLAIDMARISLSWRPGRSIRPDCSRPCSRS